MARRDHHSSCLWTFVLWLAILVQASIGEQGLLLQLDSRTGGALRVSWELLTEWQDANWDANIDRYSVSLNGTTIGSVRFYTTSYALYGLEANSTYVVQIIGTIVNSTATVTSNELVTATLNASIPAQPPVPDVVQVGGGFLRVRVNFPEDTGGVPISTVMLDVRSQFDGSVDTTLSNVGTEPEFVVYGLTARSIYRMRAYVINSAGLSSAQTQSIYQETAAAQSPGPCPPPSVLNTTGGSIALQLNPPTDDGGARIKGYVVYMSINGSAAFDEVASTFLTSEINKVDIRRLPGLPVAPLQPRTRYDFYAVALNSMEVCVSQSVLAVSGNTVSVWTADASLPEAPPSPYFLSAAGGRATVQLLMPANMRGSALTGFSVMVNGTFHSSITTTQELAYEIMPLSARSNYSIQVAVTTDLGESAWSSPALISTSAATSPQPVTDVVIGNVTASKVFVQWSAPFDSGGVPIVGYALHVVSLLGSLRVTTVDSSTSYWLTTLVAETVYTVKVAAINAIGKESSSLKLTGATFQTLAPTAPSAPHGVRLVNKTGGMMEIAWQRPDATGGFALDDLVYNVSIFSVATCSNVDGTSSCDSCNLIPTTDSQFQLIVGLGACATPSTSSCPDGSATCCVSSTGELCQRTTGVVRHRVVAEGQTSVAFFGLKHTSSHLVGVQAINAVGRGQFSPIVELRTSTPTPPTHPMRATVLSRTGGSVRLSWSPPLDAGGGGIVGYYVYRDYVLLTPSPVFPPYQDCGGSLLANTQYLYGIAAVNASLMQGSVATVPATTGQATLPQQIESLQLTSRTVNWINVTINVGCDGGGATGGVSYQYIVRRDGIPINSGFVPCCSLLLTSLSPYQAYDLSVQASNEVGELDWITEQFSTTSGVPQTPAMQLIRANSFSIDLAPDTSSIVDYEILQYDVEVSHDSGGYLFGTTVFCGTVVGPGQRTCPSSFRLDGLTPNTSYLVAARAVGPAGFGWLVSQTFSTVNEDTGVIEFATSEISMVAGSVKDIIVRRVTGTAGVISVDVDVSEPSTVGIQCVCVTGKGCECGLHLRASGTIHTPGQLVFLDGQENQTLRVTAWEDDAATNQPTSVLLSMSGSTTVLGPVPAAIIHVYPSEKPGLISFVSTNAEVSEDAKFVQVNLVRLSGSSGAVSATLSTFNLAAIAGKDYMAWNDTVRFSDGQTTAVVWIQILNNAFYSGNRAFGIGLRNPNNLSNAVLTKRITIVDDDDPAHVLPSVPWDLQQVKMTGGSIGVAWQPGNTSDAPVNGYVVRVVSLQGANSSINLFTVTEPAFEISWLPPTSVYRVQVAAWNQYGEGPYTIGVFVHTSGPTLPSGPRDFLASAVGSSSVVLSWRAPHDTGGSTVTGYTLWQGIGAGELRLLANLTEAVGSFAVEDLSAATDYQFVIAASTKAFPGATGGTSVIQLTTQGASRPAQAPAPMLLRPATAGTASFLIREPQDTGGSPIIDYILFARKVSEAQGEFFPVCSGSSDWAVGVSSRSCTVYKLLRDTSYEFYVVVLNVMGPSPESDRVVVHTTAILELPSTPVAFRASRVTAGLIALTWEPPLDLGGAEDATGYTVYQKMDIFSDEFFVVYDGRDSTDRQAVVKLLNRYTDYSFAIVAQNLASYCVNLNAQKMSDFLTLRTLEYSPLSPPLSIMLQTATGGSLAITWSQPDDLAGLPLIGYMVELSLTSENGTEETTALTPDIIGSTFFRHVALSESTTYKYAVTAINQDGPGERSLFATFSTTECTPPQSVQNLRPIEAAGGRIVLAWELPEDTGGRTIVHYEVVRTDRPGSIYTVSSPSFVDVYGLSAWSQYVYAVRAYNGLYLGQAMYIVGSTGEPSNPAPPELDDVAAYGGKLNVSWSPSPDTGGVSVVEYVFSLTESSQGALVEAARGPERSHVFMGLNALTQYQISISVVNQVGEGPAMTTTVFTSDVDLPSAPPAPTANEVFGGRIVIAVTKPIYDGGEDVSLLLHNGTAVIYDFGTNGSTTVVTGLVALTQYKFHVIAVNSRGQVAGDELIVSTGDISTPSDVTTVVLVLASFDRLSVTWPFVDDNGGDTLLEYEVSYFKCTANGDALTDRTAVRTTLLEAVLLGLDHSSMYCVAVQPVTSSGLFGPASPIASFTTEAPISGQVTAQKPDYEVREDAGQAFVPLFRIDGSYGDIEYYFETSAETGYNGVNYVAQSGTLTMASGTKTGTIAIPLLNDASYFPNVTFVVTVRDVATDLQTQTRVYLLDDGDAGFISFTAPSYQELENTGTIEIPIVRDGGTSPVVTIEPYIVQVSGALATRFTLDLSTITFEEGISVHTLMVVIEDDGEFQFWPDSIVIGLRILSGGAWVGDHTTTNITALDDGDISPPKHVTGLKKVSATGGSMTLQWSSPLDRGGANVELTYRLAFALNGEVLVETNEVGLLSVVYGLNASTNYHVTVQAVNTAGGGLVGNPTLLSTTVATPPTAPFNVAVLAASSSSLTFTWSPPLDSGGSSVVGYKIFNVNTDGTMAVFPSVSCALPTMCTVRGLLALTPYRVQIQAITTLSSSSGELSVLDVFQTSNPDVPDPPPIASVVWASAGAMTIKMFSPLNVGGSDIQEYRLFMRGPFDEDFVEKYLGTASSATIYRLERRSVYAIKYQVINVVGPSAFGETLEYSTLERSLPSAPLELSVLSVTGGAIGLKWTEPLDVGGRSITGYTVMVRTPSTIATGARDLIGYDGRESPQMEGVVYGLDANSLYTFYVIAYTEVSNCFSASELVASASLDVNTSAPTLPSPAPTLVLASYTGGLVELLWNPPIDTGGVPIVSYTLLLLTPTGGIPLVVSAGSDPGRFKHIDLIESTIYTYAVRANSSVGESPLSQPLLVKTLVATAPSAPTNVKQLGFVTGGAIQIGWDRPLDTGGQPLRGFWIYRDGTAVAQNVDATSRSYIDSRNLQASTSYEYTVRAFSLSSMGSEMSASLVAKTASATRPAKPLLFANEVGASFITANWSADSDTGGVPILMFDAKLVSSNDATVVGTHTGLDLSFQFTSLSASTGYTLAVVAHNQVGASEPLIVNFMTTAGVVPNPPPPPVALFVFGGNLTVNVVSPIRTGGSAIVELRVYEATRGFVGAIPVTSGQPAYRYTIYGLLKTTNYVFSASAVNAVGEGSRSASATVRTGPVNVPGPIASVPKVGVVTGTSISVTWAAPLDTGGDSSVSYEVRFVDTSGLITPLPAVAREAQATGLKFNTVYTISVRVGNSVGKSAWSQSVTVQTLPDSAGVFNMALTAVNVSENASQVVLTVLRTNGVSGIVTVSFTTAIGLPLPSLAMIGSDYEVEKGSTKRTGVVTFSSQQTSASITILISNDVTYESPDEYFDVALTSTVLSGTSSVTAPSLGVNTTSRVTIVDDGDAGTLSFLTTKLTVRESSPVVPLLIIREGGKSGRITFRLTSFDGTTTVDRDYRRMIGIFSMAEGVERLSVPVLLINDKLYEYPDEFFTIQITPVSGGALVKRGTVTIVIEDDGDVSVPATPPPPVLLQTTGGSMSLQLVYPIHNGSSTSQLTSFTIRISTPLSPVPLFEAIVPAEATASIGNLTATTPYDVYVATNSSFGQSEFSTATRVVTSPPSLPGPVTVLTMVQRTGGSIQLAWQQPSDTGGVPITKYRVYLILENGAPMVAMEIPQPAQTATIAALTSNTNYTFFIQAGNAVPVPEFAHGWGSLGARASFSTTNTTLPAATTIIRDAPSFATGGAFTISFSPPLDSGGEPILSFHVYARNASAPFTLVTRVENPELRSARVEERYASSWYEVLILAVNRLESTALSGVFTCSAGATSLITSQDLSRKVASGSVIQIQSATFLIGDMALATKGTLPLAVPHTGSAVSKQPASLLGVTQQLANVSTTAPTIPQVPPPVELVNATGGAIAFKIVSPGDTGGVPIEDFTVFVNGAEPDESTVQKQWNQSTHLMKTLVMRVARLEPETPYEVAVIAGNAISVCDFSKKNTSLPIVLETTQVSRPGLPQVVSQTVTGGGMTLSLVDPFDNGGRNITRYQLYMATDAAKGDWRLVFTGSRGEDDEQGATAAIAGLKSLAKYVYKLSVFNGEFESENSTVATIWTSNVSAPGQCGAPSQVGATGGMIEVEWLEPLDDGGAKVIDYRIRLETAEGRLISSVSVAARSYSFYGLDDDTEYSVSVRARNEKGLGPDGVEKIVATTVASAPVGNIEVEVLSSTGGAAIIRFNPSQDLGGTSPMYMKYQVIVDNVVAMTLSYDDLEVMKTGGSGAGRRLATSSGIIVGGLDPLAMYNIQIQAVNDVAGGNISAVSTVTTTAPTLPSAPQDLEVYFASAGYIELEWSPPADTGGVPLVGYSVYMGTSASGPFSIKCQDAVFTCVRVPFFQQCLRTVLTCRVGSLTASTSYWFYVIASNTLGDSPASSTIATRTNPETAPSKPGKVQVNSVSHNAIDCFWLKPIDDGGAPIVSYTITVKDEASGTTLPPLTSANPSVQITGLSSSTKYRISVVANNQLRSSYASTSRVVTTASAASTQADVSVACVSSFSVGLVWFPYPGATRYRVYQNRSVIYTGADTMFTATSPVVSSDSYYEYTLEAEIAGAWAGTQSQPIVAQTLAVGATSDEVQCTGPMGYIQETNYAPNSNRSWVIEPSDFYSTITIEAQSFDLECDHDVLSITQVSDDSVLWSGGCKRVDSFIVQADSSIRLRFTSDASVQRTGFSFRYEIDRYDTDDVVTRIPPPVDAKNTACSSHGTVALGGTCKCSVGFTGEACNNYMVCCSDPKRCWSPVCDSDPTQVIAVSDEFGDDVHGTGEMMKTSEKGSASKAVQSLSKALSIATDGDIIFVYPGVYKGPLNRDLHVTSRQALSLQTLKSFAWTTLDCEALSRAFAISNSEISIEGLTIKAGAMTAGGNDGGALWATDSRVTLRNVLITGGSTTRHGGAVALTRSKLFMVWTSIKKSEATAGGGGGMYLLDSLVTMNGSNVTTCTAMGGGAVFAEGTTSEMVGHGDASIFDSTAGADGGGGVSVRGQVILQRLSVHDNEAPIGGGVFVADGSQLKLDECHVYANNATSDGGGVALIGSVTVESNSTRIDENIAFARGGGVFMHGAQVSFVSMSSFESSFQGNTAQDGAGVFAVDSTITITGVTIHNGTATASGGAIGLSHCTATLANVTFTHNSASVGGGIAMVNSDVISEGSVEISNNVASTVAGGGYIEDGKIQGPLVVMENTADQRGGGIYGVGAVTLEDVVIQRCHADEGGGVYLQHATLVLANAAITNSSATTNGGGIAMNASTIHVTRSQIERGDAAMGGGVFASDGCTIIGNLTISDSSAVENGGGLYATDAVVLQHVAIVGSTAKRGGGFFLTGADATIENVTASACMATIDGGGGRIESSSITLHDTQLTNHSSRGTGGGIAIDNSSVLHANVTVAYSSAAFGGSLTLVNSSFHGHGSSSVLMDGTALQQGGNIVARGNCSITSTRVTGGESRLNGGGLLIQQADVSISNCEIANNHAGRHGGGVSVEDQSTCELLNTTIRANSATLLGGGMRIHRSSVTHENVLMLRNKASNGGAFVMEGVSELLPRAPASRSSVNESSAIQQLPWSDRLEGSGSAAVVAPNADARIAGLHFNHGQTVKGGIFVSQASLELNDSVFYDNAAASGGALYVGPKSSIRLNNTSFIENAASTDGGAIFSSGDEDFEADIEINNCDFTANSAEIKGAAIQLEYTTLIVSRTGFTSNRVVVPVASPFEGTGGAICISQSTLNMTDCGLDDNTVSASSSKGGALYMSVDSQAYLERVTFGNSGTTRLSDSGGLIYASGISSVLSLVDCTLENGHASLGGSLFITDATTLMVRSEIRSSQASDSGGGLYIVGAKVAMVESSITSSTADYDGGGIYVRGRATVSIRSSIVNASSARDGGGGLFVAPGGGALINMTNTTMLLNTNKGLGSAVYIGRKNVIEITDCEFFQNGAPTTEGGTLYAADAHVTVTGSSFQENIAVRGAAVELSRDAKMTMTNCELANNSASVWGGALYTSVRAAATITQSTMTGNTAAVGGGIYALGSTLTKLSSVDLLWNRASSFGGAVALLGYAELSSQRSIFSNNSAYTGGAVSVSENASLSLDGDALDSNRAEDFGGALYVDTLRSSESKAIALQRLQVGDNTALTGADVYWVFHAWFRLSCDSCASTSSANGKLLIATSPAEIFAGWWPSSVTSGVSLGVTKPNWKSPNAIAPPNTTERSGPGSILSPRRLTSSASSSADSSGPASAGSGGISDEELAAIIQDPTQTSPYERILWPTLVVRDFYGAISVQDNATSCLVNKASTETDKFEFYPSNAVDIRYGYVTLADAEILAVSRLTPFDVRVTCTLAEDVVRGLSLSIQVETCSPGYENTDGRCVPCKKGTYSMDGVKCHLCPLGATCERLDEAKNLVGVSLPSRSEGYFLFESRETYKSSNCDDPSSWDAADPCRHLDPSLNMTYRLQNCSSAETFERFWPRKRVFACLSAMEYYACDTRDACTKDNITTVSLATTVEELSESAQCDAGYDSVTCSTCRNGYYKVSNGTCHVCSDPNDPAVARMTKLMAMIPVGFLAIALLLVWYYFSNSFEKEIMRQAKAARKYRVYDASARPPSVLQQARAFIEDQSSRARARIRDKLTFSRRRPRVFNIAPAEVAFPAFRAEKFKIMLGFFQIFGGFKKLYEIPWPDEMSRLMDLFSVVDFSLVDTTGIECFIHKDYFSNYRLSLVAVLSLLFATTLLLAWGVIRYRVKLAGIPRHCVQCGLPVFEMLRRKPKTLVRRSTMVSMLRMEKKKRDERLRRRSFATRATAQMMINAESSFTRVRNWWMQSRLGRLVQRFIVLTRLPASSSEHHPRCPTTQEVTSEVQAMVVRSNLRLWRARIRLRLNYQSFQNKCIKLFFWVLLLFYPELSQRVVGMFYCDELGSNHYMTRDKSQLCYQGTWLYYLPLTLFLVAVWVIGVPLLFWVIIFAKRNIGIEDKILLLDDVRNTQLKNRLLDEMRQDLIDRGIHVDEHRIKTYERDMLAEYLRNKKLSEPSMIAQVGFIYHSYRTQFWWFEVWDLGRKLCVNCVIGLLAKSGANRIIAGLIVFLIYLSIMLFYQPYKEHSDSALAGITQIQLFVTLFCGLMLKMGASHLTDTVISLLTYVAFVSNCLTIAYAVFSIIFEKVDALRKARRRAREEHRLAVQAHVRTLWHKAYAYAFTEVYLLDPSIRPMPVHVILELARRNREAQQLEEMETQLVRSFPVECELYEDPNEPRDAAQVDIDMSAVDSNTPEVDPQPTNEAQLEDTGIGVERDDGIEPPEGMAEDSTDLEHDGIEQDVHESEEVTL